MSKKSAVTFFAGFISASAIFGALHFLAAKPVVESRSETVATVNPGQSAESVSSGTGSVIAVTTGAANAATTKTSELAKAAAGQTAQPAATSVETEAFRVMMTKGPDAHSAEFVIKKGDSLYSIAKKHGVTAALLKRINGIEESKLRVGSKIKIPVYRFSLLVDKFQNRLTLKGDDAVLKTYVVSTGENNSTPVGVFKVTDKLVNPTWYKAGAVIKPDDTGNQLGSRWLGLTAKGYGIHGTTAPDQLGRQVTAGCVRLKNSDVEELYDLIPAGIEVAIVDTAALKKSSS